MFFVSSMFVSFKDNRTSLLEFETLHWNLEGT